MTRHKRRRSSDNAGPRLSAFFSKIAVAAEDSVARPPIAVRPFVPRFALYRKRALLFVPVHLPQLQQTEQIRRRAELRQSGAQGFRVSSDLTSPFAFRKMPLSAKPP